MKSKERHELKQNEFAVTAMTVAETIAANRTKVAVGIGALVVLVAIIGGTMLWKANQANKAGAMLGTAMAIAQAQIAPASTLPGGTQQGGTFPTVQARADAAIQAFNEVIAAYPGTDAAVTAKYHVAAELLALGRAAEAEQAFAAVVADAGDSVYGSMARLGQAEAMLAAGRTDEASTIFSELAANREGPLPVDGLLVQLGRASLKAGKTAEARAAFQRVLDEFPESIYVTEATQQLSATN